jgi:hypothetical protein
MMQGANGKSEIDIISEIRERGFTVIPTRPHIEILDAISDLSSQLFRTPENPYDHAPIDRTEYGLIRDSVEPLNNQADIVMGVRGGFSFLRIRGSFFRDYTTLMGKQKDAPRNGESDHPLKAGEPQYLAPRVFDPDDGIAAIWSLPGNDEAAAVLKEQLPVIYECIDKVFKLAMELGIDDLFSPTHADNFHVELPFYFPGSVVDLANKSNPTHQHDRADEMFFAIQTTSHDVGYVSGRTPDNLEQTFHHQGEVVAVDAQAPHGPKPTDKPRASVIFSAFGPAREVLYRACDRMERDTDWQPTPASRREAFQPEVHNTLSR